MTQFTYGAMNPLNIHLYTLREITEYLTQMERAMQDDPIHARTD